MTLGDREMRAVIGPNGDSKTTMSDISTGKTRPDTGDVLFDNGRIDFTRRNEVSFANSGVGRKFQRPSVFENHTVAGNILLALASVRSLSPPICRAQ